MISFNELQKKLQNLDLNNRKDEITETEEREPITSDMVEDLIRNNSVDYDNIEYDEREIGYCIFRISQLIQLAKIAKSKGIPLGEKQKNSRGIFTNCYLADDNGYIGFDKNLESIGFVCGGVRGAFDFWVNSTGIYLALPNGDNRTFFEIATEYAENDCISMLKVLCKDYGRLCSKFIRDFNLFEESFKAYLSSY